MSFHGDGLRNWMIQRVSAVYMALFFVYLFLHIWLHAPHDYVQWRAWVATVPVNSMLVLFVIALMLHVWVGMRDVILDYVHHLVLRTVALVLLIGGLLVLAIWMLGILYSVVAL